MERIFRNSQGFKLESQIREAFGRVVYSQTCHEKEIQHILFINKRIKIGQIILSAITASGFLGAIFSDTIYIKIGGVIASALLLMLNSYAKDFLLVEEANKHICAADRLWKVREKYVSLITDFDLLDCKDIMLKRDNLQDETYAIYSNTPRTDKSSYKEAQRALKIEEEQTFSDVEIDRLLPSAVQRKNREII